MQKEWEGKKKAIIQAISLSNETAKVEMRNGLVKHKNAIYALAPQCAPDNSLSKY